MTGSWLFCQEKVLDAGYASKQLLRFLLKQVNEKAESSAKVWVSKAGVLKGGSQTEWIICFKLLNNLWFRREFFLIVCVIHSKFHFYQIYHCKIRKTSHWFAFNSTDYFIGGWFKRLAEGQSRMILPARKRNFEFVYRASANHKWQPQWQTNVTFLRKNTMLTRLKTNLEDPKSFIESIQIKIR